MECRQWKFDAFGAKSFILLFQFRQAEDFAIESYRTTHGAPECLDACRLFCRQLLSALAGEDKHEILFVDTAFIGQAKLMAIVNGNYRHKTEGAIQGTAYVIDSLEALYGVSNPPTTLPTPSSNL